MASTNSKVNVTKAQSENHKRILQQLLRLDDNRRCADCNARGPTWASVNLGVFVCLNCSGVHRSLGTHMSKVRSTTLDTWLPEQVAFVEVMGNRKANLFWEAELPVGFHRPFEGDMEGLKNFIGNKYRDQAYAMRTWDKSPSIDNYTFHPFMTQVGGAEANTANSVPVSPPTSPPPESSSTPVTNGVSSTVAKALAPPSGGGQKRAAEQFSRATTTPAEPAQLFDLLSMDEAPPTAPAAPSQAATSGDDGGWAAFAEGSGAPAAVPTAEEEDPWDAFQTAMSNPPAQASYRADPGQYPSALTHQQPAAFLSHSSAAAAAVDLFQGLETHIASRPATQPHPGTHSQPSVSFEPSQLNLSQLLLTDPFAKSGGNPGFANFPPSQSEPVFQSRAQSAPSHDNSFIANFPEPQPAAQQPAAVQQGRHAHKKSADDILRMFDKPAASQPYGAGAGGFSPSQQGQAMYPPSGLGLAMKEPHGAAAALPRPAGSNAGYMQSPSNAPAAAATAHHGGLSFF